MLRLLSSAALVAGAMLVAGCSSGGGGSGGAAVVASVSGHAGTTAPARSLTQQQSDQDMVDFARCMRGHGVPMADPSHRPGHAGLSIDMPGRDASNGAAYAACTHFIAPVLEQKAAGAAAQAAPELPALTRYAQCMRGHDINMLDPTPQGELNLGRVPGITDDFGRYSPQFRAADVACRHFLPTGIHDDGTGP
jgi:hypothetical protein